HVTGASRLPFDDLVGVRRPVPDHAGPEPLRPREVPLQLCGVPVRAGWHPRARVNRPEHLREPPGVVGDRGQVVQLRPDGSHGGTVAKPTPVAPMAMRARETESSTACNGQTQSPAMSMIRTPGCS